MALDLVYEKIKKQNGESFARALRTYDSGILEIPDIVDIVKYAGYKAEPILPFLSQLKKRDYVINSDEGKNPFELLSEAGYDAFYVDTYEKQVSISKYFDLKEALCTFRDKTRFERYHIIHCIKRGAEKLKRCDFTHPKREDAYGASVISIQLVKSGSFIKITNRYNHAVCGSDNTFDSNPDNIIKGLTRSIEKYFNTSIVAHQGVALPMGYIFLGNRLFKYHTEKDDYFIGETAYAKDGVIYEIDKDKELIVDCYVLNLKYKGLRPIIEPFNMSELMVFKNEIKDKKLEVKALSRRHKVLLANGQRFLEFIDGEIVYMHLNETTEIPGFFMQNNTSLRMLSGPNVTSIGTDSLQGAYHISFLYLPKLRDVDFTFLSISACQAGTPNRNCLMINRKNKNLALINATRYHKEFVR